MSIKIGNYDPATSRRESLRAEAERRFALAEMQAAGALKRLGIQPTGGKLNVFELDKILSEKRMEPRERIALKSQLASIGWID
jgi:hypothetical protein